MGPGISDLVSVAPTVGGGRGYHSARSEYEMWGHVTGRYPAGKIGACCVTLDGFIKTQESVGQESRVKSQNTRSQESVSGSKHMRVTIFCLTVRCVTFLTHLTHLLLSVWVGKLLAHRRFL